MTSIKLWGALLAVGIFIPACSSGTGETHPGGASDEQVARCKQGCDVAKQFGCSDTDGLSKCYDDCNSASPSQIDKFNSCAFAGNEPSDGGEADGVCDPSCRGLIDPQAGGDNSGSGSGSGGGSGGGSGSGGGTGGGGGGGDFDAGDFDAIRCQDDCSVLHEQSCITSDELSTCNDACNTAGSARTNFESCEESANMSDCSAGYDCFTTFSGG